MSAFGSMRRVGVGPTRHGKALRSAFGQEAYPERSKLRSVSSST